MKEFIEFFGFKLESRNPRGKHPMTRVFQAIRMSINDETGSLEDIIRLLPSMLKKGGRAGIITFHSLEDRAVKWGLRETLRAINKKVIKPSDEEVDQNPRSRSAKLRVFEKE